MLLVVKDWAVVSATRRLPFSMYTTERLTFVEIFSFRFFFYTYNFDTSSLISDLHDCIVLQSVSDETVALPGLTSIASGKAVELFARMLHHPEG